jgi:hypothetical protein
MWRDSLNFSHLQWNSRHGASNRQIMGQFPLAQSRTRYDRRSARVVCLAPLIRLRHLLPPKSTGGEGARRKGLANLELARSFYEKRESTSCARNRAPSPPRFPVGEKVAEGRMRGQCPLAPCRARCGRQSEPVVCLTPLIRLRHLLPPKSTGGEGARCRVVGNSEESVRNAD